MLNILPEKGVMFKDEGSQGSAVQYGLLQLSRKLLAEHKGDGAAAHPDQPGRRLK